jgi:hypothetical protein
VRRIEHERAAHELMNARHGASARIFTEVQPLQTVSGWNRNRSDLAANRLRPYPSS